MGNNRVQKLDYLCTNTKTMQIMCVFYIKYINYIISIFYGYPKST